MSDRQEKMETLQKSFLFPRLLKLLALKDWPVAVPLMAQFNEIIPQLCRLPYDDLYRDDPEAMAECSLLVWEYLGVDSAFAFIDSYNMEIEAIGGKIEFYADHIPDVNRKDYFVKGKEDLAKLVFKGLHTGRYPYTVKYYQTFTKFTGMDQFPEVSAPWSMACNLYGMENLILACLTEPEFVHAFMEKLLSDVILPVVDALREIFPEAPSIVFPDAWCTPPIVTAEIAKEFIAPYIARLKAHCDGLGAGFGWGIGWVTGLPQAEREYLIDLFSQYTGYVYGLAPDAEALGPRYFRDYATKKGLPLVLGLAPSFLQLGTPEQIRDQVRDYLLIGKNGPTPMALLCGCIGPHVPPENIQAVVDAVRLYGTPEADEKTPLFNPGDVLSFEDFLRDKIKNNRAGYSFSWLPRSGYAHLPD